MEFTEKELQLIAAARKKVKMATLFRIAIIISILCAIVFMFSGIEVAENMLYFGLATVFLSVALPQIGHGPKYEDLLHILESKANSQCSNAQQNR